ncbi:Farnesyl pyrophosphate synthase [Frankliniella fusca]|uniref:Farnesyl pyrophosphate synthase n=1 Tax=Frankliniella fusca TaxID=407009 RepID=A0AAE1I2U1_9NEOP|nr:Farnesyl pyrophosphate synthase [Frankliniella fusca]
MYPKFNNTYSVVIVLYGYCCSSLTKQLELCYSFKREPAKRGKAWKKNGKLISHANMSSQMRATCSESRSTTVLTMRPLCSRAAALGRAHAHAHRSQVAAVHGHGGEAPQPGVENQLAADRKELLSFFPTLAKAVQVESQAVGIPHETEWIGKMLHYVVPKGRLFRGCSALNACRELLPPDRAELGKPLGLAFEMGYITIIDDLVDEADLRRGQPSWHTLPGVGLHAVNDAFCLHSSVYKVLQRYFRAEPSYAYLFELFNECIFRGIIAQNYECHNGFSGSGAARFDDFNHEVHSAQAFFKISYYSFYGPLAAALHLAGASDRSRHEALWRITKDIGMLFAVQDDYSDCYESEAVSGKSQCDIRNGKCTWMVAEAKRRASESQLALLKENYGFDDAEKVAAVMHLYAQLGVQEAADEYIRSGYARIAKEIDSQCDFPPGMLHYTLDSMRQPLPAS